MKDILRVFKISVLKRLGVIKKEKMFVSKNEYHNPVDNKLYVTKGEFKSYRDGKEVFEEKASKKETKMESIILLHTDEQLSQAKLSIEDLSQIIEMTESKFNNLFLDSPGSGKIMVQFDLHHMEENTVQFALKENVDTEKLGEFEKQVKAGEYPKPQKGTISFQILFKINSFDE